MSLSVPLKLIQKAEKRERMGGGWEMLLASMKPNISTFFMYDYDYRTNFERIFETFSRGNKVKIIFFLFQASSSSTYAHVCDSLSTVEPVFFLLYSTHKAFMSMWISNRVTKK
jgi:hypothetical protein